MSRILLRVIWATRLSKHLERVNNDVQPGSQARLRKSVRPLTFYVSTNTMSKIIYE
jgi:hypothetical protein